MNRTMLALVVALGLSGIVGCEDMGRQEQGPQ